MTKQKADNLTLGASYRLYGKIEGMKRFKPLSGEAFTDNLIYAEVFTPQSAEDVNKMIRELDFLNEQGTFEFRRV